MRVQHHICTTAHIGSVRTDPIPGELWRLPVLTITHGNQQLTLIRQILAGRSVTPPSPQLVQ
jgi:hypothetical protein